MNANLPPQRFADFFQAVHGYYPFPWQQRLAEQVIQDEWPDVINIPTGCGKSAALDIAVYALAANPQIMPRRIAVVVDRRIIVDQLHSRAEAIADKIASREQPILANIADALQNMVGDKERSTNPLIVSRMRGGAPIDDSWAEEPHRPWIITSTVDQLGSRILHRGYGVSPRMRPIHAGLAGNDILIILDEVHLSAPFAETLNAIERLNKQRRELPDRFKVVQMSATAKSNNARIFNLEPSDIKKSEELNRRANAQKQLSLSQAPNRRGLPRRASMLVKAAAKKDSVKIIGVIANRVNTAIDIFKQLKSDGVNARLITGRMRPMDRTPVTDEIARLANPDEKSEDREFIAIVSTQAIEVGADFSFDELITECAPADSLIQRIGRLDRRGTQAQNEQCPPIAHIISLKNELTPRATDPIYGDAVKNTWFALEQIKNPSLQNLKEIAKQEETLAPKLNAPLMLRSHMEALCQTNPEPRAQPQISDFLHGIHSGGPAEVSIVWRRHRSAEHLTAVPPRAAECLTIPLTAAVKWLRGDNSPQIVADVTQREIADPPRQAPQSGSNDGQWTIWNGSEKSVASHPNVDAIQPGDLVVAAPELGGLSFDNWDPYAIDEVKDIGDHAQQPFSPKIRLAAGLGFADALANISPNRMPAIGTGSRLLALPDALANISPKWMPSPKDSSEEDESDLYKVERWLEKRRAFINDEPLKSVLATLSAGNISVIAIDDCYIIQSRQRFDPSLIDGSDETISLTGTRRPITLKDHMEHVGARAEKYALSLGISERIAADLKLAGRFHDIGKADARFQLMLAGGDKITLAGQDEPLAKSVTAVTRINADYPARMRHESISVALLQSHPDALRDANDPDLVLHLIAAHHGYARPFPQIIPDPNPQSVRYEQMQTNSDLASTSEAMDSADRFWRLTEQYGAYGLSWLEAILRLADHRQSEKEARIQ